MVGTFNNPEDNQRLKIFLKKLEHLQSRQEKSPNKWPMPVFKPNTFHKMPLVAPNIVDNETGFEYSTYKNIILDRSLQLELDLASGVILDIKTGNKFSYSELTEYKKSGQVNCRQ
jgi:hypothetical protein